MGVEFTKLLRSLNKQKRELLLNCLWVARQDEKKAIQYFKLGAVPIKDAIELTDRFENLWFKAMDEGFDESDINFKLELEKSIAANKRKQLVKKAGIASGKSRGKWGRKFFNHYNETPKSRFGEKVPFGLIVERFIRNNPDAPRSIKTYYQYLKKR